MFLNKKFDKKIIIFFCLGVIWCNIHYHVISRNSLSSLKFKNNITYNIKFEVLTNPLQYANKQVFTARLVRVNNRSVNIKVKCFNYDKKNMFHKNETWQATGIINNKYHEEKYHVFGQIFIKNHNRLLLEKNLALKDIIIKKIHTKLDKAQNSAILEALLIGNAENITKKEWDLFKKTGTTHLMVVSGSHIALMVTISWLFFGTIWRKISNACLIMPAQQIAAILGIILGWIYAYLCGFNVSTERAVFASSLCLLQYIFNYPINPWQAWKITIWITLIQDPHAILFPGTILSFICVAILLNQLDSGNKFYNLIKIQFFCLIITLPLCVYWFDYGSINSIITNLIAIPWLDMLLPIGLISLMIDTIFNTKFIIFIGYLLKYLISILTYISLHTEWVNIKNNIFNIYTIYLYYFYIFKKFEKKYDY